MVGVYCLCLDFCYFVGWFVVSVVPVLVFLWLYLSDCLISVVCGFGLLVNSFVNMG